MNFRKAINLIKKSRKIVISSHISPDGDAVGSCLALYNYCKNYCESVRIVLNDDVPNNCKFMDKNNVIEKYSAEQHSLILKEADLFIVLDLNELNRVGGLKDASSQSGAVKIMLDHHQKPQLFADVNYSSPEAAATGELVYQLIRQDKQFKITPETAEALYVAIMTDTGNFRFSNTNDKVLKAASELAKAGANPNYIYEQIYCKNPRKQMLLYGEALANLEFYFDGYLCIMPLDRAIYSKTGTNDTDVENFVESLLTIDGVNIGVMLSDAVERNEIRLSFRSKDKINIRSIAERFGGGGHINAAGARVKNGDIAQVKQQIIEFVKEMK